MRKYDDLVGRFFQIDPMWEMYYGWTPYHYCRNNPVSRVDISGYSDQFAMAMLQESVTLSPPTVSVEATPFNLGYGTSALGFTAEFHMRYMPYTETFSAGASLSFRNQGFIAEISQTLPQVTDVHGGIMKKVSTTTLKAGLSFFSFGEIGTSVEKTTTTNISLGDSGEECTTTTTKEIPLFGEFGYSYSIPGAFFNFVFGIEEIPIDSEVELQKEELKVSQPD